MCVCVVVCVCVCVCELKPGHLALVLIHETAAHVLGSKKKVCIRVVFGVFEAWHVCAQACCGMCARHACACVCCFVCMCLLRRGNACIRVLWYGWARSRHGMHVRVSVVCASEWSVCASECGVCERMWCVFVRLSASEWCEHILKCEFKGKGGWRDENCPRSTTSKMPHWKWKQVPKSSTSLDFIQNRTAHVATIKVQTHRVSISQFPISH